MDLANLITQPGPDPITAIKSRGVYSPPEQPTDRISSYFSSLPTSYKYSPQPPLSPPAEEQPKCSLPSISTLIESADNGPMHAASMIYLTTSSRIKTNPITERQRTSPPAQKDIDSRYESTAYLPPTPPLRPGSGFHSNGHSPSGSTVSVVSTGIKTQEPYQQGHFALPSPRTRHHSASVSSQGSTHHFQGPYASPAPSVASYSPVELPASSAVYYQRPAVAPPAPLPPQQIISPITPTWQHHHYFPPSSSTPYQQNQDRYICRTCHKAFSRPSSLRIHSHSHTGEKPFRCTHAGCGKAFSVRSNMKRHERGCHSGRAVTTAVV